MVESGKRMFALEDDPLWYKDAIIYEVHVRAFFDGDADGVGDFTGLTRKLEYLEELGITAIWLLPFYPSPLRDDGYDISDYNNILPVYGSIGQFKAFVAEAHRHGIRVITELVLNHTSDQHPWFQRARLSPPGSRYRDYYVWNDTSDKYKEARIIFTDSETSNWSWDPVAKAFFWHRFYHHQPDLNYDNPVVRKKMLGLMDFWLKMGVDGVRVDAVPYLFEREGTDCENLPETHEFVRELRHHIDSRFKNRMLLAEANQWPEDTAAYFGKGDEFHMSFNFPIMPRLFMALRMEDRFPIIDILRQTPEIPETSQWALFLRNHDELTLEMVTDEERDYMYRAYAADPAARINLGIRRRLAPLLGNDRRKIELMNSLLLSLPGTPVLYYGDEIGMGDNYYLGDRNGVRTPMQWSSERNTGFSEANPQRLYLPPIIDPEYHYETINVENQVRNPDSLLWWMRRIIALRKRHKAFGRGTLEFFHPRNRRVLSYLRQYQDENILCIANLSHTAQQTTIDLSEFKGAHPVDLFGRTEFQPVGDTEYCFTLNPYAYFWFSLEKEPLLTTRLRAVPSEEPREIPTIEESLEGLVNRLDNRFVLEALLLEYTTSCRFFRGAGRDAWAAEIQDIVPVAFDSVHAYVVLLEINYADGDSETYTLPLMSVPASRETRLQKQHPRAVVARLHPRGQTTGTILIDAMADRTFGRFLLPAIKTRASFRSELGEITASPTRYLNRDHVGRLRRLEPQSVAAERSNTSLNFGERYLLKLYRRLEDGVNPDVEIGRFLTEKTSFHNISFVAGSIEYKRRRRKPTSLAILQGYIPNEGDAWQYTLDTLERYFENVTEQFSGIEPPLPEQSLMHLLEEPPQLARDTIGAYLPVAHLFGTRTADLHTALGSDRRDPEFAPEPFTFMYQASLYQSLRSYGARALQSLREYLTDLPEDTAEAARSVLARETVINQHYDLVRKDRIEALRIRCHGDYHLDKLLYTGNDFVITDFEGETGRPLGQRRMKRSPLRDIAGMIRSFHYAAHTVLHTLVPLQHRPEETVPLLRGWAQYWYTWVAVEFLRAYFEAMAKTRLIPPDPDHVRILLEAFLLDKALYEVNYELTNRSNWVHVPIEGISTMLDFWG
jgi:maltose alpha-D-glucosyltransferase/alpha-amylase